MPALPNAEPGGCVCVFERVYKTVARRTGEEQWQTAVTKPSVRRTPGPRAGSGK